MAVPELKVPESWSKVAQPTVADKKAEEEKKTEEKVEEKYVPSAAAEMSTAGLIVEALAFSWPIWVPVLALALLIGGLVISMI